MLVADVVVSYLKPIQQKITEYISDPEYLLGVLTNGSAKCKETAEKTIKEVREKLGIDFMLQNERREKAVS